MIPSTPGYYWFRRVPLWEGTWRLIEVFRPMWSDPNRQDFHWRYLDGSGGDEDKHQVSITHPDDWSIQVLPPEPQ